MHDEGDKALHLTVHGRVQGVCYRASAQRQAQRLGLHGWVRNRRDGTVEALVGGPRLKVDEFVEWARKGPPGAVVNRIDALPAELSDADGFSVAPTA